KDVIISSDLEGDFELIIVFIKSIKDFAKQFKKIKPSLKSNRILWISYPKGPSNLDVDLSQELLRLYVESIGMRAVSVISIDKIWSAMRLKIDK
ncbi:MAG: hypothetical protein ACW990_12695, partial [Promethearchaeota archaeon]